jgi:hypothetical protein
MLALRFFGGGLLALMVATAANRLLTILPFPTSYAAVLLFGAALLLISTLSFVSAGEPEAPLGPDVQDGFGDFLHRGLDIFRADRRFRLFVYVRWLAGAVAMALPFYVLQATRAGLAAADVAILLGAQTAGALASNPLWGLWGDRRGKRAILEAATALTLAPAGAHAHLDRRRGRVRVGAPLVCRGVLSARCGGQRRDHRSARLFDGDLARRAAPGL